MQNKPQLSAEMERKFRLQFSARVIDLCAKERATTGDVNQLLIEQMHFLATALEEQRMKLEKEQEEYLEEQAIEEAHRTDEGYCCACGYDMAVMAEKINAERQKVLAEVEGWVVDMENRIEKERKLKVNRQTSVPSIVKQTYGGDWVSHYYERHQGFISALLVARNELRAKVQEMKEGK